MVHLGLQIAALIVFLLATFPVVIQRVNLVPLGLALLTLSFLLPSK